MLLSTTDVVFCEDSLVVDDKGSDSSGSEPDADVFSLREMRD